MRHLILASLLAAFVVAVAIADELPPAAPTPPQAVEAQKKHDAAIKEAKEAYHKAVIAADQQYIADLDAALKQAMTNQNIGLARLLDDEKKLAIAMLHTHQADADTTASDARFRITKGSYGGTDDLEADVQKEFGDSYRVADWRDIKPFENNISAWADSISFRHCDCLTITCDHQRYWNGTNRQFAMDRFDAQVPGDYLAHDQIGNNTLCLGSWFGSHPILAVKK